MGKKDKKNKLDNFLDDANDEYYVKMLKIHKEFKKTLSYRLKNIIELKPEINYPSREILDFMGIDYRHFQEWIDGKQPSEAFELCQIARYYRVNADYLLGLTDTVIDFFDYTRNNGSI